jgi:hypothetical protein
MKPRQSVTRPPATSRRETKWRPSLWVCAVATVVSTAGTSAVSQAQTSTQTCLELASDGAFTNSAGSSGPATKPINLSEVLSSIDTIDGTITGTRASGPATITVPKDSAGGVSWVSFGYPWKSLLSLKGGTAATSDADRLARVEDVIDVYFGNVGAAGPGVPAVPKGFGEIYLLNNNANGAARASGMKLTSFRFTMCGRPGSNPSGTGTTTTPAATTTTTTKQPVTTTKQPGTTTTVAAPTTLVGKGKPTAAVVLGDSYSSGEGGGDYLGPVAISGTALTIPASDEPNNRCHRSRNASLFKADLPGIDAKFNLACSGGRATDLWNEKRRNQKNEYAQVDYLAAIAKTHDVKLILIGVGGNDVGFADVLLKCSERFLAQSVLNSGSGGPCGPSDMPTPKQMKENFQDEVTQAVQKVQATMAAAGQAPGSYRIILQSYPSPLPSSYDNSVRTVKGIGGRIVRDTDRTFAALATARGDRGCPFHEGTGASFSRETARWSETMSAVAKATNVEFLALDKTLVGRERCSSRTTGQEMFVGMFSLDNKALDQQWLRNLSQLESRAFVVLQESMHPNALGFTTLGVCVSNAWKDTRFVQKTCDTSQNISEYGAVAKGPTPVSVSPSKLAILAGTATLNFESGIKAPKAGWTVRCITDTDYFNAAAEQIDETVPFQYLGRQTVATCRYKEPKHIGNIAKYLKIKVIAVVDWTDPAGNRYVGSGELNRTCTRAKKWSAFSCTTP